MSRAKYGTSGQALRLFFTNAIAAAFHEGRRSALRGDREELQKTALATFTAGALYSARLRGMVPMPSKRPTKPRRPRKAGGK